MIYKIDKFEEKTPSKIDFDTITLSCGEEIKVYTIETVHDLTQFIGYGKYMNCQNHNVYLRGQTALYDGKLIPSLYRGKINTESITMKYNQRMNEFRKNIRSFHQYERNVLEPLLQHYGIKTPYIDLVDNVWVSLWFALHQANSSIVNSHEYIYYHDSKEEYAYILLIASDARNVTDYKGVYDGEKTMLVDLRNATPSYFLRPHAQHAFMLRKKSPYPEDYSDLIVGIGRIPTELGFKWLGTNDFLTVNSLFPAIYFDSGYGVLMKKFPEENAGIVRQYGSIQVITD